MGVGVEDLFVTWVLEWRICLSHGWWSGGSVCHMGGGVEGLFVVGLTMENGVSMPNEIRNKPLECNRVVVWGNAVWCKFV